MNKKWMVSAKKADFQSIADTFHLSPVTARLIRNRDVVTEAEIDRFLHGDLTMCHDPFLLPDAKKGMRIVKEVLDRKEKIRVVGDYDVDGICATSVLMRGLTALGGDVTYRIPHRVTDGYGISDAIVDEAARDGVALLLTCDNGIAQDAQARRAHEKGMRIVITDHHDIPFDTESGKALLPDADAVTDPKRTDVAPYPYPEICGAVVAYKCLEVLFTLCGQTEVFEDLRPGLIELSALATVCDVMPLQDENRILVKEGLSAISASSVTGLRALAGVTRLAGKKITAYYAGFILGPCLNASGRLDTASRGVELFLTDDENKAVRIAEDLKDLNESRKQMTASCVEKAKEAVLSEGMTEDKVLVVFLPDAHESVAGIVAGRVREQYERPAIVLTKGEEGIKGSARSIPAYDMFASLSMCKDLFSKFGGHPMAAGLSLKEGATPELLRKRLNDACTLTEDDLTPVLHLDMELPPHVATLDLIEEWACLEPFGTGNARPHFAARDITFVKGRLIGREKDIGKYTVKDTTGATYELMLFRGLEDWHAFLDARFGEETRCALYEGGTVTPVTVNIAYYPDINEFQGRRSVQLIMEDYA